MTIVHVNLLGAPVVLKDDKQITFPYRKAEALFYYLLMKKRVARDDLVNIFWGNNSEKSAKKNLRNAIYVIKKVFEEEILISPQRSIIELNPSIDFRKDIDKLLFEEDKFAEVYKGVFLEGFLVKDADKFEEWLFEQRNFFRDLYIKKLYKAVESYQLKDNYIKAEYYCKKIIKEDEFDEKAYRKLLEIYRVQGKYNKCVNLYNNLVNLLDNELSISPDYKTVKLFESILKERSKNEAVEKNWKEEFIYGRKDELKTLIYNYYRFLENNYAKSIAIIGEAGIGKSKLVNVFINRVKDNVQSSILFTTCYKVEKQFLLNPWHDIIKQLKNLIDKENIKIPAIYKNIVQYIFPYILDKEDKRNVNPIEKMDLLKYQVAEKVIVDIFNIISLRKKIIIVIEDLQWIDDMSMILLKKILLNNRNESIIIVTTFRNTYDENIDIFLAEMGTYDLVNIMHLERFSKKDTIEFVSKLLNDYTLKEDFKDIIYRETEGNPLFIVEYVNNIKNNCSETVFSPKMKNVFKMRVLDVSYEGRKILNIASVFFDKVTFEALQSISGKNEFELLEILEELQKSFFLVESKDVKNNIIFKFTHQKLREFIYEELTLSKRRILHRKIAFYLEKKFKKDKSDRLLFSRLIYHFQNAGDKISSLYYRIKYLYEYLHLNYEIFPIINYEEVLIVKDFYITEKELIRELKKIESMFSEISSSEEEKIRIEKLKIDFLHMIGRYYIVSGKYEIGISMIQNMIDIAMKQEDYHSVINGYLLKTYYCINVHDYKNIDINVNNAMIIAENQGFKGEKGVLTRLKGYKKVMTGEFEEGERLLKKSIEIFNSIKNNEKYLLNIAAAYYYIGESKRFKMKFEQAIDYYEKAIQICESKGLIDRIALFNTSAGQAAYDMGDYDASRKYLEKALSYYRELDFKWGRSIANGYIALLFVRIRKYSEALKYLKKAEIFMNRLKNPYEIGLVYRVKAEICNLLRDYNDTNSNLFKYMKKPSEKYCEEAIKYFKKIDTCYEIEILKNISFTCGNCKLMCDNIQNK